MIKNLKNHFIFQKKKNYFAIWRNFASRKKVVVEPFVDAEVRHGFSDMDYQLDLMFLCEAASYEEINSRYGMLAIIKF